MASKRLICAGAALLVGAICGGATAAVGEGHLFAGTVQEAPYYAPGVSVSYGTPSGQGDAMTAYTRAAMLSPISCTAGNLRVALSSADPGYLGATVTMMQNGVATSLTCLMFGANSSCSDTTHSFAVAAGDSLALLISPSLPQRPISNVDSDIEVKLPFSWRCVE